MERREVLDCGEGKVRVVHNLRLSQVCNRSWCLRFILSLASPSLLGNLSLHLGLIELLHEGGPGSGHLRCEVHHDGESHLGSQRHLGTDGKVLTLGHVSLGSSSVGQTDVVSLRSLPVEGSLHLVTRNSGHDMTVAGLSVLHLEDLHGGAGDQGHKYREYTDLGVVIPSR